MKTYNCEGCGRDTTDKSKLCYRCYCFGYTQISRDTYTLAEQQGKINSQRSAEKINGKKEKKV